MQRKEKEMRLGAVPTTEIRAVDGEVSYMYGAVDLPWHTLDPDRSDATIGGIAIKLPGPLSVEEQQTIIDVANAIAKHATDPFVDNPHIPQICDGKNHATHAQMKTEAVLGRR